MVTLVLVLLAAPPADYVGRVVAVSGEVSLNHDNVSTPAIRGDYVKAGDTVKTGVNGSVRLLMRDKSVLALPDKSSMKITAYDVEPASKKRRARLTMLVGRLWAMVTKAAHPDASYEVSTANAVAGVRGTELVFEVDETGDSEVTVITGEVDLAAGDGHETLGERERGSVAGAGIDLRSTDEKTIAELREDVRPEQELDDAKAAKRLEAARKKADDEGPTALEPADDQAIERDDPGTGDSVFEDVIPDDSRYDSEPSNGFMFDPSTMSRVRVRVEVRE